MAVSRYGDIDVVQDYGADPTWAAYSDTAFASAIAALAPGQVLGIPPGLYKTSAPIILPPYRGMTGARGTPQVSSWSEYGSVIKPGPYWQQGSAPLNAVILMVSQADGGYSGTSEEQHLDGLLVSGSALPAGQVVHGIASYNTVNRVQMSRVHVARVTGSGIYQDWTMSQPDAWTCDRVFSRYNGGYGFRVRSADSNWTKCLTTNSGLDGWSLDTCVNNQFAGCRSEWSGGNGYHYVCHNNGTGSGSIMFAGCSTDRSSFNGFIADGSGGASVPLLLSGCSFRRDGAAGGTQYAALAVMGYPATVTATGCLSFPGVNDDGTGLLTPYYGVSLMSGCRLQAAGDYWQGNQHAWALDGTSVVAYNANSVTWARGTTSAPVIVAGP